VHISDRHYSIHNPLTRRSKQRFGEIGTQCVTYRGTPNRSTETLKQLGAGRAEIETLEVILERERIGAVRI
jgi:hypothetical protein